MKILLTDLSTILKALRNQNRAPFTSGQLGPKSTKTDKEENVNKKNS